MSTYFLSGHLLPTHVLICHCGLIRKLTLQQGFWYFLTTGNPPPSTVFKAKENTLLTGVTGNRVERYQQSRIGLMGLREYGHLPQQQLRLGHQRARLAVVHRRASKFGSVQYALDGGGKRVTLAGVAGE